jgi:predicted amidophosphoribosyltransferase
MSIGLIWLLCAVAGAMIGSSKGETGTGFVLGLLFGPFGILFAWLKGNRQTCQACKSSIHAEATICPNCRTPLSKAEIEAIARVKTRGTFQDKKGRMWTVRY